MTTDTTAALTALHAHLDAHPDDWDARRMLADLLDDLGDTQGAACQRWMALRGRMPHWAPTIAYWMWLLSIGGPSCLRDCRLPYAQQATLTDLYATRQAAESALCRALVAAGEI